MNFMPFRRELTRSETQTALSKIWTWITDFIFHSDNRYAKCAHIYVYMYVLGLSQY